MDLSIIIVNWNSADYIRKCISSIYENTEGIDFEIVVVDNASYDDCKSILKNEFPEVIFIQSKKNLGFAKANNLGFKYSSGKVLLFLNPDTEILGEAINRMYFHLIALTDAGAIGCKLLNTDLSIQTSCVQPFPTILNQFLDIEAIKWRFPKLSLWGMKPLFVNSNYPVTVEVISGACLMIKRKIFEEVGLFSTDYFMYTEDIDLCFKVKLAGYKAYYSSKDNVIHHGGGSIQTKKDNRFSDILMRESIWTFTKKNYGIVTAYLYKVAMFTSALLRLTLFYLLLLMGYGKDSRMRLQNLTIKWGNIFRWSLGLEKWAKALNNKAMQM